MLPKLVLSSCVFQAGFELVILPLGFPSCVFYTASRRLKIDYFHPLICMMPEII